MSKGPTYHIIENNPEKSVSEYLHIPYNADFEKYYENNISDIGLTLPGSKYIGPGNSLNLGEPITDADEAAKIHDLTYSFEHYKYSQGEISKEEFENNIRASDFKFIKRLDIFNPQSNWARSGLVAKQLAENLTGQIYPSSKQDIQKYNIPTDDIDFHLLGKNAKIS